MSKSKVNLLSIYAVAVTVAVAALLYWGYPNYNARYEEGYQAGYKDGHDAGWENGRAVGILEGKGKLNIIENETEDTKISAWDSGNAGKNQVAGSISTEPTSENFEILLNKIFHKRENSMATVPTSPIAKTEKAPTKKQAEKPHGYVEVYDLEYNFEGYATYEDMGFNHSNYDGEDEEYLSTPGSSIFTDIKYDYIGKILYVRFRNSGEGYCYYNVPYDVWYELKDADSMGSYFNSDIKGYYQYERGAW